MKLFLFLIALLCFALFLIRADESDIESCMEVTGWSYDRCEMALNQ